MVNALRRTLRGDMDRILQRALAKSPEARYATVGLLADDLSAYVEGRAISGGSRRYRARVFVKRHWLPLAATAALLLVIVIGSATVAWQARRTEHQAQTTLAVKDFLFGLFTAVDPTEAKGRTVSANELLDRGAKTIGRNTTLDIEQRGEIEATLGRIYFQLGLYDQAKSLQDSAALKLASGAPPDLLARAKRERAETLASQGDLKTADSLATQARAETDALPAADIADRVGALHALAVVTLSERDFARTKSITDAALVDLRHHPEADPRLLIRALRDAGSAEWGLQLHKESEADWRESIAVAETFDDEDDFDLAKSRVNLALAMQAQSRYAEAARLNELVIKTSERLLGSDHPMTLRAKVDFALARLHMGYFAEAQAALEKAVEEQRKKLGADHLSVAGSDINLGLAQLENGDCDAAEKTFREAMGIFEKKYGRDYQGVRIALGDLAQTHLAQHRLAEADVEMTELMAADAAANNEDLLNVIRMGDIRRAQQRFDEALALERPAVEAVRKKFGENSRVAARAHHYLALTLRDQGDAAAAESEFRAAMNSFAGYLQDGAHPTAADIRGELANVLKNQPGRRDEIIRLLTEAAAMREHFFGADDARTRQAQAALRDAKSSKI